MTETSTRWPAVAGLFYPETPDELESAVRAYLGSAQAEGPVPKAVIAPHAGYVYSGPVAATAYARLAAARRTVRRVVLIGPAHRVPIRGVAASSADAFATPLGEVPVDRDAVRRITALPQVRLADLPHRDEHSLEVHLPFLQLTLEDFAIVPLVVGDATAEEVAQVLEALWGGPETLILVSSDLSHYHDYETARRIDAVTSAAIERLSETPLNYEQACGAMPINGLVVVARRRGLSAAVLDLRNSGDTAGPRHEVVGYGAYAFL